MRILFIIFPQRSHLNATLPLAREFSQGGHEIVYSVCEELRRPVEASGFTFVRRERDVYPFLEQRPRAPVRARRSILQWGHMWRRREDYQRTYRETGDLTGIVTTIRPDIVLIDRAYALLCPALFALRIPFGLLVSMGNLNHTFGFPPHDTRFVPTASRIGRWMAEFHWRRYFIRRCIGKAISFHLEFDRTFLRQLEADCAWPGFRFDTDRYIHPGIREAPEFLLFPREFDFPRPLAPNQYHVGTALKRDGADGSVDFSFAKTWSRFCSERDNATPIVFCGLGTAAWRYKGALAILRMLVDMARHSAWNLVVAAGALARELKELSPPPNVLICETLPQLDVLAQCDVMINHGGMNSIVESIAAGVPMLVCPGMKDSDQPGNAARVCFHGLGESFNPLWEGRGRLRAKISLLLSNPRYRQRVGAMRSAILRSDAQNQPERIVLDALTKHFRSSLGTSRRRQILPFDRMTPPESRNAPVAPFENFP